MDINVYALVLTRIIRILIYTSKTIYSPMTIFIVPSVLLARKSLRLVALNQILLIVQIVSVGEGSVAEI